jgi:SOS response regulatory protein OraA/RecX
MRDHSERELRQKLKRMYEPKEIDEAIEFAREHNLLAPEEAIAERTARALGRKRKGHRFISQYLKQKGLPAVAKDADDEVRKAIELVEAKLKLDSGEIRKLDFEKKMKVQRLLANRGFDLETIRRVIG